MKPLPFFYTAPIGDTATLVPFPDDLSEYGAANFQIENTGAAALTALVLKSKAHPDADPVNHITDAGGWVVGSLVADINGSPFTLAAGATANILLNCKAQYQLIFEATCGTATTLAIRGFIYPDGGVV
jgi:hypothetical protein